MARRDAQNIGCLCYKRCSTITLVVRVPRNSCFITEAFDTTVTATLSINSSRERRYVILQTGREDTSDLLTVAVHFPFSQKLPAIFGRENLRGAWKCLSFSSSFGCFRKRSQTRGPNPVSIPSFSFLGSLLSKRSSLVLWRSLPSVLRVVKPEAA